MPLVAVEIFQVCEKSNLEIFFLLRIHDGERAYKACMAEKKLRVWQYPKGGSSSTFYF